MGVVLWRRQLRKMSHAQYLHWLLPPGPINGTGSINGIFSPESISSISTRWFPPIILLMVYMG